MALKNIESVPGGPGEPGSGLIQLITPDGVRVPEPVYDALVADIDGKLEVVCPGVKH